MAKAAGGDGVKFWPVCLATSPRSLHCLGSALWGGFLFGGGGRFSHFSLLRLLSHEDGDIDEEELVRCSSNPQTQNQVHCQFELKRWPSTAAPGSKSHPACHSPKSKRWSTEHHRSPNLDGKKNAGKSSWTERTNRTTVLNQLNHWIHLMKVWSQNEKFVRQEGRPHELVDIREHAPFFSHLVPGPLRKLQFSFCKTSLKSHHLNFSNCPGILSLFDKWAWKLAGWHK